MHALHKDNRIFIYDSYILKESIKEIPGRLWHPEEKAWSVPLLSENIETIDLLGCELSDELKTVKKQNDSDNENDSAEILPLVPMPLKIKPYAHQIKAFNFACKIMNLTEV